jgi:aspartate carbamoyltransferase catalytic subunit
MRHIIESQQFTRQKLEDLFTFATTLEGVRNESLKGKILASLFYEPSTRTRLSFESAMLRLGGEVLTMENGDVSSSQAKGETLEDSIRVINNYADVIVLRHPEQGSAKRASKVSKIPVINAGDGTGQHPTQALLDLYTIHRELGHIDGIHVAFVGNLKYYRSPRSLSYLLGKFKDIRITFVTAPELRMKEDVKTYLKKQGVRVEEMEDVERAMREADVVYQTRVAKEYIKDPAEYEKLKDRYVLNRARADSMKKGAIIIHPLPRVGELLPEVDDSPHAVYFKQVGYGLLVRMALLKWVLE